MGSHKTTRLHSKLTVALKQPMMLREPVYSFSLEGKYTLYWRITKSCSRAETQIE